MNKTHDRFRRNLLRRHRSRLAALYCAAVGVCAVICPSRATADPRDGEVGAGLVFYSEAIYESDPNAALMTTTTLTGRGSAKPASPSSVSFGSFGDGNPGFLYSPSTGDVQFILNGLRPVTSTGDPSFIVALQLTSSAGLFTPSAVHSSGWTGRTRTSSKIAGALVDEPGFADGINSFSYDIGTILPSNLSYQELRLDLTLKYQVENDGGLVDGEFPSPEPSTLALIGLGAMGILSRRWNRRLTVNGRTAPTI